VTQPEADLAIPMIAAALGGRYLVKRVIARGGMAIVYVAEDRELGRQVAIKVLDPERSGSQRLSAERFLREVRITAQLQHPNIIPLIDSGRVKGLAYAVFPYVEGESLRDLLVRQPRVPLTDALLWTREIAEALEYAHQRGIVHRDIKPENILLSNGQAVVSDFGVAYARHLAVAEGAVTGVGETLGTPAYMSPEQIEGAKVDGRSDIYSLGCMLYEMLGGRPPFDEPSVRRVLNAHLKSEALPIEALNPDVPDRVAQIVRRAMAKQADQRYETAGAKASALRKVLGEPPRHVTPTPHQLPDVLPKKSTLWDLIAPRGAGGWLVLGALALLAVVLLLPKGSGLKPRATAPPIGSLAVMAPEAAPAGSVPGYLTEGLAGEVINVLQKYSGMRVTPQASSFALSGRNLTIPAIGDTLGVASLLTSAVSPSGSGYNTTVRLHRASDGSVMWQRTYQFAEGNLGSTARQIGADAAVELAGGEPLVLPEEPDLSAELTSALLQGRYWVVRGTPEATMRAHDAFAQALQVDSLSVEALTGMAGARMRAAAYGYRSNEDFYSSMAEAIKEARRAYALDSTNRDAAFIFARAARFSGAPSDSVIRMYRAVLAISPDLPDALIDLGQMLGDAGKGDSAVLLARRAVELNPLSAATRHGAITVALRSRKYDVAIEQARARLAQDPGDLVALALEGLALSAAGRSAECVGRAFGPWLAAEATCFYGAGRTTEAQAAADSLRALLLRGDFVTVHQFTDLGTYYAWSGNNAEALRWIQRAADQTPMLIDWVLSSGLYDKALADPTFRQGLLEIRKGMQERLRQKLGG
jgi:serine/threonine-protein kinase